MKEGIINYSDYFWQGEKIRLRSLCIDDAKYSFINSFDSPARQLLQLHMELPTSEELEKNKINTLLNNENKDIIILPIDDFNENTTGCISIHSIDEKNGKFSFGIFIYKPYRKKGYAKEAVRIVLKYGFLERRFNKCNSACSEINKSSIQLHKSLGFIEEGRRRQDLYFNGRYYDDILWGMTREEFDALNAKQE
jgi:RimJ/RimL family protein N-acetyltransferase